MDASSSELGYRFAFALILFSCLGVSATFRLRARREAGVIPRKAEPGPLIAARLLLAVPLGLAILSYPLGPDWLPWSRLELPDWMRTAGVVLGAALVPAFVWMFRSIGSNISETVLTRDAHELVTHGPYRWVRHPLYALGSLLILALGLIAASWLIIAFSVVVVAAVRLVVIPREEENLVAAFGEDYRAYTSRTGCLFPRLL